MLRPIGALPLSGWPLPQARQPSSWFQDLGTCLGEACVVVLASPLVLGALPTRMYQTGGLHVLGWRVRSGGGGRRRLACRREPFAWIASVYRPMVWSPLSGRRRLAIHFLGASRLPSAVGAIDTAGALGVGGISHCLRHSALGVARMQSGHAQYDWLAGSASHPRAGLLRGVATLALSVHRPGGGHTSSARIASCLPTWPL